MPCYLPIQGTHSWHGCDTTAQWWQKDSPFNAYMKHYQFSLVGEDDPFIWSTDLDGVPFGRPEDLDWEAAGVNLRHYICPPRVSLEHHLPYDHRNLIAHSHGGQVVLYACANGLKIRRLITICAPVRLNKRMRLVAAAAKPNIEHWLHIWSGHDDTIQWLGSLFDWQLRNRRAHPSAHANVHVPRVGHSRLLNDPLVFHLWEQQGWLDLLR
jgi:hypothetical protein